jgi:hypothetical protein
MKHLLLFAILFTTLSITAQNLDCKQYRTGKFYIPVDDVVKSEQELIRNELHQIEKDGQGDVIYTDVNWLNDCTYVLTFNEELTTRPISESEAFINENGGVVITIVEILENGYVFEAYIDFEDEPFKSKGTVYVKK